MSSDVLAFLSLTVGSTTAYLLGYWRGERNGFTKALKKVSDVKIRTVAFVDGKEIKVIGSDLKHDDIVTITIEKSKP